MRTAREQLRVLMGAASEPAPEGAVAEAVRSMLGADEAAVLVADVSATFAPVLSTGEQPDLSALQDPSVPLGEVLRGRRVHRWSSGPPLPTPRGWRHGLACGVPLSTGHRGLLLVGRDDAPWTDADGEQADVAATLLAPILERRWLAEEVDGLARSLTGAVAAATRMLDGGTTARVRGVALHGLVEELGLRGAALWEPAGGRLVLTRAAGVPDDVLERLTRLDVDPSAVRVHLDADELHAAEAPEGRPVAAWPGHRMRAVQVPPPVEGVLGVFVDGPLRAHLDRVIAPLGIALARAVERATLDERAHEIADALVRELRPRPDIVPPSLDVGSIYRSATRGARIGGDYVDWFATESDDFAIACGDVSGKGVASASLTAMVVHTLRAFAPRGMSPRMLLRMMNGAVIDQTGQERFTTMAYARLQPESGRIALGLAGHPSPMLISRGTARLVDVPADVPLGLFAEADFVQHELRLEPGESLVLATDGVTEARRPGWSGGHAELLGERRVAELLSGAHGASAQELADRLWAGVERWTGGTTTDDCAIVVVRRR